MQASSFFSGRHEREAEEESIFKETSEGCVALRDATVCKPGFPSALCLLKESPITVTGCRHQRKYD